MLKKLYRDEAGFIVSMELILVLTLAFCGAIVGFTAIRNAIANELHDVSKAISSVNQSYAVGGIALTCSGHECALAQQAGFGFNDQADDCDASVIDIQDVCGHGGPGGGSGSGFGGGHGGHGPR